MRSTPDVVDALGGSTAVGAFLKIPATTVASWKSRGSIPVSYWSTLVALAAEKEQPWITLEALAQMHAMERRALASEAAE